MKIIPFNFILKIIIPELRGLSKDTIAAIQEIARQSSIDRIKKYYGYCFAISICAPFLILFFVFFRLNLFSGEKKFLFTPILGAASGYLSIVMVSAFSSIILAPEIRKQ